MIPKLLILAHVLAIVNVVLLLVLAGELL